MNTVKERVLEALPKGAIFQGIVDTTNPDYLIIQFLLNDKVVRGQVKKINLNEYFKAPVEIEYKKGMTYEDIYWKINDDYGLGLDDNIEPLMKGKIKYNGNELIKLPINSEGFGYNGSITIFLWKGSKNIVKEHTLRDLRGFDFTPLLKGKQIQSRLGRHVFKPTSNMFTVVILTSYGKEIIREYLKDCDETLVNNLVNGYIIKSFNDGLSDMFAIRSLDNRYYLIRFDSSKGDIPL